MATPLSLSSTFSNSERPYSSITLADQAYVLSIVPLQSHYAVAATASTDSIHLLDKSDCKKITRTLDAENEKISALRSADSFAHSTNVLLSCGNGGSVKSWDERSGAVGVEMRTTGRKAALLCCDASSDGMLVAAGSVLKGEDASILYWDPRNPVAPLRQHTSTHSDDVTSVRFSRSGSSEVLLSASTDGLISMSNPLEEDDDEAGLSVANWGCSISKAGWIQHESTAKVWAISDMETVSIWNNDLDSVRNLDRDYLAHPHEPITWVTDYIIDCHTSKQNPFAIMAGSSEGDIALISPSLPLSPQSPWNIEKVFTKNHTEVVRCALWDDENGILLTGGEDSKLNVWSCPSIGDDAMDVDSTVRKRTSDDGNDNSPKRVRLGS